MLDAGTVLRDLGFLAPEAALAVLILLVIVADIVLRREKRPVGFLALIGTLLVLALALEAWEQYPKNVLDPSAPDAPQAIFMGSAVHDQFGLFFRIVFLAAAVMAIVFTQPVVARWATGQGEAYALMLACTLGMMFMASANDLLMMYLSLEFVSVTSYILAGLRPRNRRSSEASLKYIIYGSAASGMMVYGISFLYGLTGTLQVDEVGRALAAMPDPVPQTMSLVVSVLVMAGFGYKIAAAPFHMWCPDVYEGAPTPVTAFFSIGPKAAGFAMLVRFLAGVFQTGSGHPVRFEWNLIVALLAVLTLAVGNLGALFQQNLKRLMAYSSIGHAGYILLAFTAFEAQNVASMIFYIVVYILMNVGAFLVVIILEESYGVETVDGCRGLGWRAPALCGLMTLFLFSLTGLPPTAGFIGKLYIFGGLVEKGDALSIALVLVGVLFSVVSLYYYMRIVAAMFLTRPEPVGARPAPVAVGLGTLLILTAAGTLAFGIFPEALFAVTDEVVRSGTWPVVGLLR